MRLDQLDLLAYGKFTNTTLDFSKGRQGLHLVYGPNEAGKSTALEAIIDFLYGIPQRSSRDFIHAYRDLRIGATIRVDGQHQLQWIRRKANTATLRAADDETKIDESELTKRLGSIDRESFRRQFGLGYQDLVEGGRELVAGRGDLAELLFSAGAGLHHLRTLREQLATEADELYKSKGQNPSINKGIRDYQTKIKEVQQFALPVKEHLELEQKRNQLREQSRDLTLQLNKMRSELQRGERLRGALKHVERRREVLEQLSELTDVPDLDGTFASRRWDAVRELNSLRERLKSTRQNYQHLQQELQEIHVAQEVLDTADGIIQLYEKVGQHDKALNDEQELRKRADRAKESIQRAMSELGESIEISELDRLRPSDAIRRDVSKLAAQYLAVVQHRDRAIEELQALQARREELLAADGLEIEPPDPRPLKVAVQKCGAPTQLTGRLRDATARAQQTATAAQTAVQRLPGWQQPWQSLDQIVVPHEGDLTRIKEAAQELDQQRQRLDDQRQALEQELAQLDVEISHLQEARRIPTADQLAETRRRRDEMWDTWLNQLTGQRKMPSHDELERFREQFATSVKAADDLADRLREQAQDVANLANKLLLRMVRRRSLEECQQQQKNLDDSTSRLLADHEKCWSTTGLKESPSPRAGLDWLAKYRQCLDRVQVAKEAHAEAESLQTQVQQALRGLQAAFNALKVNAPKSNDLSANDLDDWITAAIETIDAQQAARKTWSDQQGELNRIDRTVAAAEAEVATSQAAWEQWHAAWQKITRALQVPETLLPEDVQHRLDRLTEVFQTYTSYQDSMRRVQHIRDDYQVFTKSVSSLANQLGIDIQDDPRQTIRSLQKRLGEVQSQQQRQTNLQQRLEAERKLGTQLSAEEKAAAANVAQLCVEARCQDPDQLIQIEQQASRRRELRELQKQIDDTLAELAGGQSIQDFLNDVERTDHAALEVRLQELERAIREESERQQAAAEQIAVLTDRLKQVDTQSAAASAAEEADAIRAQLVYEVQRFARLKFAETVLATALEQYREKHQGPVLQLASDFIQQLSGGSLSGLRSDEDDRGQPVLIGVRPDGKTVTTDGMSEGLADQLYLALRLASFHQYKNSTDPLPLIFDDVLIKFDDQRSEAALKLFVQLSDQTQVIYFTHHRHLVDLATRTLPNDKLFVQELPCRP